MSPAREILYLVGFMGAGKSSVGVRVAALLGWRFVDLDASIEERAGKSIRELFRREGEPHFRRLERDELGRVSAESRVVVALGGGAFCSRENQSIVRNSGTSVYLEASAEVLHARASEGDSRPLLTTQAKMASLLDTRRPFYECADRKVDVSCLTVEETAQRIVALLRGG